MASVEMPREEMATVETEKVYVKPDDGTAMLKCPYCGTTKTGYVGKFKGARRHLKIRCACQSIFRVLLEFRQTFRKESELQGYHTKLPYAGVWGEMLTTNLSISGVGFVTLTRHELSAGDEVKVKFTLDDGRSSKIEKKALVRWVKERNIGCEFTASVGYDDTYDTVLNFYLIPR
jgi:hypothetical protein